MNSTAVRLMAVLGTSALLAGCAAQKTEDRNPVEPVGLTQQETEAGVLTPEIMWKMGRVGSPVLSPDGSSVLYTVTRYDMASNRGTTSVFSVPAAGGESVMAAPMGDSPSWAHDGAFYYMDSDKNGDQQLWKSGGDISKAVMLTHVPGGIEGYSVSPDGSRLLYVAVVKVEDRLSSEVYPDMDRSSARIYDDLMVRHWNYWEEGKYRHIFLADMPENGATCDSGTDIMEGEAWDAPMAPYFDMAEIAWSPDSRTVAYTCKKMKGSDYAVSTDSDIYIYEIETGLTTDICKFHAVVGADDPMPGYDRYPVFSPSGDLVAFRSMARAGNESDLEHIMVWDRKARTMTDVTPDFDYSAENLQFTDEQTLMFTCAMNGTQQLCRLKIGDQVETLTSGVHDITSFSSSGDVTVFGMMSMSMATELFLLRGPEDYLQLTDVNGDIYAGITLGEVRERWVRTTDGKDMLTWVILPPGFDESRTYPALLYCEGGPQSTVSQFWSFRWNFQLMAAQGYVVVAPNRRGVPSFGKEWLDQISGDYSGQNISDYLSAIDDVASEPWVDSDRLGAVGASYGGYSVFYLAGVHQNRFKALIAHCGIFDFDSMYCSTEEMWFVNRDYGGAWWDADRDETVRRTYQNSPHRLIDRWNTPILIFTGENDFRIPYTQSLEAFNAARMRGVPARLVEFTDEAHQVFKPQNSVVWNREFFGWLDKYLK